MITSLYLVSNALYVYAVHIFINSIFGRCVFDKRIEFLTYVIFYSCLLYTSPSPRAMRRSRMPSSA